jgi:hypothetical protein
MIQMVYIEDQKISIEFHPRGVKSRHRFSYASQNTSVLVPHP